MNLDNMMQEPVQGRNASLVDHEWMVDDVGLGRTSEPSIDEIVDKSKNPNNTKPELEVEWGTAGPTIDFNEPAGVVERNIPDDMLEDVGEVIVFARDQMNRGKMGKELTSSIKAKFNQGTLRKASEGLRELFKLEGIIGCLAVDGTGYKSCREAMEAASHSPYKHFIKRVIGCSCGDPHMLPDHREMEATVPECSGNAIDDFFSVNQPAQPSMLAHCRLTMLPLIGQDIDESELSSTMIDMVNVTGLPQDVTDKMWKDKHNDKYGSNLDMLQAAFQLLAGITKTASTEPYEQPVDASEFHLARADNEIELFASPMEAIEVDEQGASQEVETSVFSSIDVEMEQFKEKEFEGSDEIELDPCREIKGDMDIEMGGEMLI